MTDVDLDAATLPTPASDTVVDARREIKRCPECSQHLGADARFCPFDGARLESEEWDPSQDSLLGAIIDDRYEVCAVLGEGGMGTVYRVRHLALDRMFAMKVLRRDLAQDPDLATRFTQEARATASIRHPNVVQITDFGRISSKASGPSEKPTNYGDTPYFVMELLVGMPLSAALKAHGVLPIGVAINLVLKMAAALGAAHEAGVVHRDLKPENVFLVGRVAQGGIPEDLRIVDFGAAKVMGASRLTRTGIVFGTPHFMSPEQASGGGVDHRTDIYALGIIMFEMFTGRVPFEADTYMGVLTQHLFVEPPRPSVVSPHAAELGALEAVILRALEKKPEARFRSMEELAAEIRRVVRLLPSGEAKIVSASPPLFAEKPSTVPSSAPPAPPQVGPPGWLLAVAAFALMATAVVALWGILRHRPTHEATANEAIAAPSVVPLATSITTATPIPSPPIAPTPAPVSSPAEATARKKTPSAPTARPPGASRPDPEFVDPWKKDRP